MIEELVGGALELAVEGVSLVAEGVGSLFSSSSTVGDATIVALHVTDAALNAASLGTNSTSKKEEDKKEVTAPPAETPEFEFKFLNPNEAPKYRL